MAGFSISNKATLLWLAFIAASVCDSWGLPWATAQIRYPATRASSFVASEPDAFPVTPPVQKDAPGIESASDFRAMSPDSWENPQSGFNPAADPFGRPTALAGSGPNRTQPSRPQANPTRWGPLPSDRATFQTLKQQPQYPQDDRSIGIERNQLQNQGQFRSTSYPLNSTAEADQGQRPEVDPASPSPSVPEDIRLPDRLPSSALTVAPDSVVEQEQVPANSNSLPVTPNDQDPRLPQLPGEGNSQQPLSSPGQASEVQPPNGVVWESTPTTQKNPVRPRRPPLTPSIAAPLVAAPPAESPNRMTLEHAYPQDQLLLLDGATIPPGTALPLTPPVYQPDLGHRQPNPVTRDTESNDYGQAFDFEKKHVDYPKLGEILKTGRYFGSATALYVRPAFQANTSLFLTQSGVTETFDFAYKLAPKLQLGFESKFGPGIELEYWGYSDLSRLASFTSDGIETATSSAWMRGANQWSRLTAINAGETLTARHRMELDVLGASFFKEVKLPRARINGKFGFQTAHIIHELVSQLSDGAGTELGSLRSRSDVRAFGPQFELEYIRPIGHTKLEFLTSASGSVLFGKQSQVIINSNGANQSRLKADEFLMTFDFFSGAQYRRMFGENRYWFGRAGMTYQTWLHGGTAVLPQDDFGLRGFAVTVGVNR
jgi:hypothetical protein